MTDTAKLENEYKQVQTDLKKVGDDVKQYAENVEIQVKQFGDANAETKQKADDALSKFNELSATLKDMQQKLDRPKTRNFSDIKIRVGVRGGAAMNQHSDAAALSSLSGGNTTYWRYLEFGAATTPAIPFMRPALANNIQPVTDKFVQMLNDEIDKALASST